MILDVFIICLLFVIGLLLSELYIILGLKLPKKSLVPNTCDNCNEFYKWYELIPIISFLINRGKCNYCNKKLSLFYPFLELLTGIMFSLSYIFYGFSYEMLAMLIICSLLIIIYVSDFKYYIISNEPLVIFSFLILLFKFLFFGWRTLLISLVSGLIIFLFMYGIRFLGTIIFKKEALGGGDVKLSAFFGFTLGIRLSIVSLIMSSFLAFPYAIYCSLSKVDKEVPFGPFLITALLIVFVFMEQIKSFLSIVFY